MLKKIKELFGRREKGDVSDQLYLSKLEFRGELRKTWLNFFVTNFRTVLLLILLVTAWGVYSFVNLPRELNPEVKIPIAVVATGYPGAGPSDVEEQVTKKLESRIGALSGVSRISSTSANSSSVITVEFEAGEDMDESIRRLSDKVGEAKADLPDDATEPRVIEISFTDRAILMAAMTGSVDGFTLRERADEIKDKLEQLPGVREVKISGGSVRELEVAYDPSRLSYYGVSLAQANQAIQARNFNLPAGMFEGERYVYPVRSDARFFSAAELGGTPVKSGASGEIVYLRDVARVSEVAADQGVRSRVSIKGGVPRSAVTIEVMKRTGGSVVDVAERSRAIIEEAVAGMPGIVYDITVDDAKMIEHDFDRLQHDFLLTLFLVAGVLVLLIGLKEAFVASLAIPLVFFVTFGVMNALGYSLNFLSVFSLLLALGMLVDDAIVVVSATKMYLRTGKFTPEEAVLLVLNDFKVVLTTTTLTTVWAFVPLLLSTGIIGSFIRVIPVAVSVTLLASLLVALMINHPLAAVLERLRLTRRWFWMVYAAFTAMAAWFLASGEALGFVVGGITAVLSVAMLRWYYRRGREMLMENSRRMAAEWRDDDLVKEKLRHAGGDKRDFMSRLVHGVFSLDAVLPLYDRVLRKILESRTNRRLGLAVVLSVLALAVMMPIAGVVKSDFFPASDEDMVYVNYRGAVGQKLDVTDEAARPIESALREYPEVKNFQTFVGSSLSQNGSGSSTELFSVLVNLVDKEERDLTSYELADKLRDDLSLLVDGEVTVESLQGGPPSGAEFEARISGEDLDVLKDVAASLKSDLVKVPGVINAQVSIREAPAEYTFTLDPDRLERNHLSAVMVSSMLRTAVSGTEITKLLRDDEEIKVMARFDDKSLPDLRSLQDLQVLNPLGQAVYLKDVADIELVPSVQSIYRVDQKRTVSLTAGVTSDTTPAVVLAGFQHRLSDNPDLLPEGYSIAYGGENEENAKSVQSILVAMLLAFFLIASTMVVQFNSFRQALFVLAAIPLSLIGVFFGLAATGISLSFPGLIGILALFGIVVKNSIILVDKMNLNIRTGIPFIEGVIDAGKSRLEAIFITSICTMLGILPITLSNEMWRSLGSSIIFGLMASSFLTLIVIPILYVTYTRQE